MFYTFATAWKDKIEMIKQGKILFEVGTINFVKRCVVDATKHGKIIFIMP